MRNQRLRLLAFRRKHCITQERAAQLCRVSFPTWNKWENERSSPNGDRLMRLTNLLNAKKGRGI